MLNKMDYIMLRSVEELTEQVILKIIQKHKTIEVPRNKKLKNYYQGKHNILNRSFADDSKPNNKVVASFPRYICNVINGYFLSSPVVYNCKDERALLNVQDFCLMNNEASHNNVLATNMSIYGRAYELLYMDENAEIKLAVLNNDEIIPIYDVNVNPSPIAFIRYYSIESYTDAEDTELVEIYTDNMIYYYEKVGGSLILKDQVVHYFSRPPIVVYENGDDEIGDFEQVISLIDCYNASLSDMANDFQYMSDSYLVLKGVEFTDVEEYNNMKRERIMLMPENSSAEFLTKQTDNSTIESFRTRLVQDICRFSNVPDLSSEEFGSQISGIALKFRFMNLETLCGSKERMFKKALQQRFDMVFNILGIKGLHFETTEIETVFKRNLPVNQSEITEMIKNLYGIISKESLIAQVPFVDDVKAEMDKIEAEHNVDPYGSSVFNQFEQ